ncbi:MAG: AraC family transcriptional regulator [Bacteroidaceae bacterium]|nr:AraC family transcriptional regulator [Bacteroidaceae bacterium]
MKFINDIIHAQLLKMDEITRPNEPLRFRNLVLVFCESGELAFELNYTSYTLRENGFLIITPLDILTFERSSADYASTVLVLPSEAFSPILKDINLLNFKYIKHTPVVYLQNEYLTLYKQVLSTLWHIKELVAEEEFDKIASLQISSLAVVQQDYYNKYIAQKDNGFEYIPRKKELFRNFIHELLESHQVSREVLFYANELGVSSGYLNEICNEVSGHSAKAIIDSAVTARLKYELSYTSKSVQELAEEYNFPSQSYFTRYYKRMTGLTPSEFRKERANKKV